MYCRQILRTPLFGTRAAKLSRFSHVCRSEVSAIKINRPVVILVNIFLSLAAAEHVDNTCPTGGGCGELAVPHHHQEVWFHCDTYLKQLFDFPMCDACLSFTPRDPCAPKVMK